MTKIIEDCDNDIKIKHMHAINQINDEYTLMDIAMNAKYLDVREKTLDKLSTTNEKVILLNNILIKEKEYNNAVNEHVMTGDDNEENKQKLSNKARNLGVEYKKVGNAKIQIITKIEVAVLLVCLCCFQIILC